MKHLIRFFFRTLRIMLGPFMLLQEALFRPSALRRPADRQGEVDRQCENLALYQFKTCPFCVKVRQEMHRLSLPIELRDARNDARHRSALREGTGATKVPCLRIVEADGSVKWMRESSDIVAYLRGRFAA